MKEIVRKSFLLGLGAASTTKSNAEKVIKGLVKRNAVTLKEGEDMLKKIISEAANEKKRIKKFAEQEAKRIAGKLGILPKIQIQKMRKRLKTMDKELSNKGKKTLQKILKEILR